MMIAISIILAGEAIFRGICWAEAFSSILITNCVSNAVAFSAVGPVVVSDLASGAISSDDVWLTFALASVRFALFTVADCSCSSTLTLPWI